MARLERAPPPAWYLGQEAFERERERPLYREWFCVGRLDQVERPGSLVVVEVAGEPQATPVRKAGSLRCPYHSWTYRLEGDLLRAPGARRSTASTRRPSASTRWGWRPGAGSCSCT